MSDEQVKGIQRWTSADGDDGAEMWAHANGEYVLFTDHEQALAALEARNLELESGWNLALDKWNAANDKRSELIDANQRLKAPVSDAEWQNLCDVVIFGQSADGLMSLSREGIDALLAARAALKGAS